MSVRSFKKYLTYPNTTRVLLAIIFIIFKVYIYIGKGENMQFITYTFSMHCMKRVELEEEAKAMNFIWIFTSI